MSRSCYFALSLSVYLFDSFLVFACRLEKLKQKSPICFLVCCCCCCCCLCLFSKTSSLCIVILRPLCGLSVVSNGFDTVVVTRVYLCMCVCWLWQCAVHVPKHKPTHKSMYCTISCTLVRDCCCYIDQSVYFIHRFKFNWLTLKIDRRAYNNSGSCWISRDACQSPTPLLQSNQTGIQNNLRISVDLMLTIV